MSLPEITAQVRAGISSEVAALLARAQAEITAKSPKCDASGKCCHFEDYGHRLYITLAELIHFSHVIADQATPQDPPTQISYKRISLPQFFASAQPQGCPYQVERLCYAREARPLGCRIYYCDPNAQSWQNMLYERYHDELKAIHTRWHVEYVYMEWRHGLNLALQAGWISENTGTQAH